MQKGNVWLAPALPHTVKLLVAAIPSSSFEQVNMLSGKPSLCPARYSPLPSRQSDPFLCGTACMMPLHHTTGTASVRPALVNTSAWACEHYPKLALAWGYC